jgi:hypothetical protein
MILTALPWVIDDWGHARIVEFGYTIQKYTTSELDYRSPMRKVERMKSAFFDLNDTQHEPSDEQLETLMEAVAEEARRRAQAAREQLMVRLQAEIAALHPNQPSI